MTNDPQNIPRYEERVWALHSSVTKNKELYLADRRSSTSNIRNAYLTFRSLHAKNKAIEVFNISASKRWCAENAWCLDSIFKNKKLLKSGLPVLTEAHDPEIITWEHLGTPVKEKYKKWALVAVIVMLYLLTSFFGIWGIQLFERDRNLWVKSECSQSLYSQS